MELYNLPEENREGLDSLIRDLTKVHPQPKSYVRKLLVEFLSQLLQEIEREKKEDIYLFEHNQGFNDGLDKAADIIKKHLPSLP